MLAARLEALGCPALAHQPEKSCQAAADPEAERRKKNLRLKNKTKQNKTKTILSKFTALHYEPSLAEKIPLKEFFITAVQQRFHC